MEVIDELYPSSAEQIAAMRDPGPDGPIVMVNLLKFHEHARYPDDVDAELTGREAYQRYGAAVARLLPEYGGRVVFVGDVTHLMIGQAERLWDEVAIVEYPSRAALTAMSSSEEWQAVAHHREAGLAGQLNIETVPTFLPPG